MVWLQLLTSWWNKTPLHFDQITQFLEDHTDIIMKLKFGFGILALVFSCAFSIEIDQNIETELEQPEDSDVSYGKPFL